MNSVIGLSFNDFTLTTIARHGKAFGRFEQHVRADLHTAAAAVLALANQHHHASPAIYLTGDGAAALSETLQDAARENGFPLPLVIIDWFADSTSPQFRNKGSELFAGFVADSSGLSPPLGAPALLPELAAFRRDEANGVVIYPSPDHVAEELDHYPGHALALLMASQPEFSAQSDTPYEYDPNRPPGGHTPW